MSTWNDLLEYFQKKAGFSDSTSNLPNITNFAIIGYSGGLSGEMWAHYNLNLDFPEQQNIRAILKNPDEAKTNGMNRVGKI